MELPDSVVFDLAFEHAQTAPLARGKDPFIALFCNKWRNKPRTLTSLHECLVKRGVAKIDAWRMMGFPGIDGEGDLRRDILNGDCSTADLLDFLAVSHPCGEEGRLYEAGFLTWWSENARFMHSPQVRACHRYLKEHCAFRYGKELSDISGEDIVQWKNNPVWAEPRHFDVVARLKPYDGLVALYGVGAEG